MDAFWSVGFLMQESPEISVKLGEWGLNFLTLFFLAAPLS